MFEWDENKRLKTIEKHGIDFREAIEIFFGFRAEIAARSEIEERRCAIAPLGGVMICVVFTMRGDVIRIITARAARKNEQEHYQAVLNRGNQEA